MIDPQVEHGGASSWFCIAANDDFATGFGGDGTAGFASMP
jgi:hypothetical protein